MWICINCGIVEPISKNGNNHCPICGLLVIKTSKEDIPI